MLRRAATVVGPRAVRALAVARPAAVASLSAARSVAISQPQAQQAALRAALALPLGARRYAAAGDEMVIVVPTLADSLTEGGLKTINTQVGEFVKQDNPVAELETDKVTIPVNAPVSGTVVEWYANIGDTVTVGQKLFKLRPGDAPAGGAAPAPKKEAAPAAAPKKEAAAPAAAAPKPAAAPAPAAAAPKAAAPAPTASVTSAAPRGGERREKMSRMRLRISERLKESQDTAASLTTFNEIDMRPLTELRNEYKDAFQKKHGIKLGFMSAFVKASAQALMDVPQVNARIDGTDVVYHDYADISVAVATPTGLVTPVIRGCESMNYADIERAIGQMSAKARDGKITLEDLAGGTFTISNGGVFGSLMGTPIINLPQSAILGMHAVKERPVVVNGQIVIRPMMYVALTYDHRIIDGREAVTFLVRVKELVEDPRRLLLDL